jgi:uncharacterized protein (DUF2237 family)
MTTRYDPEARNVLGTELKPCSVDPVTGFFRNGCCETSHEDVGLHTVCAPRWKEALDAGAAPQLVLDATHEETLAIVPLGVLKDYSVEA